MRNCVRCGAHVNEDRALRCPKCRAKVQEELEGKANRDYQYYFRYHLKRIKHDRNTMQEMLKDYN